ncbi:DUF4843 domain-containing protein [Bacteroides thetaiotaomicron]|uniref:DUF4843 domain-containing protein n=1 Tax=Bacteroides thetaiotaomicron TaxID=818 RepID=UPI001F2CD872|nr:DUF4843 domain-containing protein [Bacteroides thetaiotaomicron]MCE8953310.1 DUF4843 domain-containing protein [Bacteroides thetaiotaomicron]MCE8970903.1 DUF4843 domain-containing protein [Bacteroides thetaiotaomicron]
MKLKKIYLQIFALLAFCSCQKEDVTIYDQFSHYLYIPTENEANIATFSFQHHLGVEDYEVQFPVKMAGQKLEEDKIFLVEVVNDEKFTTALPGDYTLPREQVFHAGVFEDVIKFKIHKTDNLKADNEVTLTIRLVSNENFGIAEYIGDPDYKWAEESVTAKITFNDKISRPEWWDDRITNYFLGEYSDAKYSYFIMSTGVSDLSDSDFTETRKLVLQFKNDLLLHPEWTEANGDPIIVAVN